MVRTTLADSDNQVVFVDEDESADVTITLKDTGGETLIKSALDSVTVTLFNASDRCVINDRYRQSIVDANGGTITTEGVITFRLQPADNPVVKDDVIEIGECESHFLLVVWTWNDGTLDRTGRWEAEILVRRVNGVCQEPEADDSLTLTDATINVMTSPQTMSEAMVVTDAATGVVS